MKVLGITGGVGSGKSEVLDYLESRYGAYVCQMDEVAKRLEKRGEICFRKIVDRFGEAVVGTDGELDRNCSSAGVGLCEERYRKAKEGRAEAVRVGIGSSGRSRAGIVR